MALWNGHVIDDPLAKGNPMPPNDHDRIRIAALETEVKRLDAAFRVLARIYAKPQSDDILEALDPNHIREEAPYG